MTGLMAAGGRREAGREEERERGEGTGGPDRPRVTMTTLDFASYEKSPANIDELLEERVAKRRIKYSALRLVGRM